MTLAIFGYYHAPIAIGRAIRKELDYFLFADCTFKNQSPCLESLVLGCTEHVVLSFAVEKGVDVSTRLRRGLTLSSEHATQLHYRTSAKNVDFTQEKVFKIREQNLRFRADFFNLFNHPSFAQSPFSSGRCARPTIAGDRFRADHFGGGDVAIDSVLAEVFVLRGTLYFVVRCHDSRSSPI